MINSSSGRNTEWKTVTFCHWYLCIQIQITAISWGKAKRTLLTINCFICRPSECLLSNRKQMPGCGINQQPDCFGGLFTTPRDSRLPAQHPSWEMMMCTLASTLYGFLLFFVCAHSDRKLSAAGLDGFSTGIHGENPGWIRSRLAFSDV